MSFWLDDLQLKKISHQFPSTPWGIELMETVWPRHFAELCSSETYRGYATVLSIVSAQMYRGISISGIEQIIEDVDRSLKTAAAAAAVRGGATLAITNAWERAHCGITSDQVGAAYESELIYAANMFVRARQYEMAGYVLP